MHDISIYDFLHIIVLLILKLINYIDDTYKESIYIQLYLKLNQKLLHL